MHNYTYICDESYNYVYINVYIDGHSVRYLHNNILLSIIQYVCARPLHSLVHLMFVVFANP